MSPYSVNNNYYNGTSNILTITALSWIIFVILPPTTPLKWRFCHNLVWLFDAKSTWALHLTAIANKTNQIKSVLAQSFISTYLPTTRFWKIFHWDISLRLLCLHLLAAVFNSLVTSYRLLKPFSHARSQYTKYLLTREQWQVLWKTLGLYQ